MARWVGSDRGTALLIQSRHDTIYTVHRSAWHGMKARAVLRLHLWYDGPARHGTNRVRQCQAAQSRHGPLGPRAKRQRAEPAREGGGGQGGEGHKGGKGVHRRGDEERRRRRAVPAVGAEEGEGGGAH